MSKIEGKTRGEKKTNGTRWLWVSKATYDAQNLNFFSSRLQKTYAIIFRAFAPFLSKCIFGSVFVQLTISALAHTKNDRVRDAFTWEEESEKWKEGEILFRERKMKTVGYHHHHLTIISFEGGFLFLSLPLSLSVYLLSSTSHLSYFFQPSFHALFYFSLFLFYVKLSLYDHVVLVLKDTLKAYSRRVSRSERNIPRCTHFRKRGESKCTKNNDSE